MKIRFHTGLWVVSLLLGLLVLPACSGGPPPSVTERATAVPEEGGESRITVLTNRIDLVENSVFEQYAERFAELYPGAEVVFEGLNNYASDITARLSTHTAGDVLLLPNQISNKELSQYFEPLDVSIADNIRFPTFKAYDGKRYGLATGAHTEGIIYNKEAFKKAGIVAVPATLDEFYEACRKLKAAGIIPVYLNYGAQWPMTVWGEDMVGYMSGNANALNDMTGQDAPWQMDNDWGAALTIVRTLINEGYTEENLMANNWEASKADLAEGRAAMYLLGNWAIKQVVQAGAASGQIGFFPFPYDNDPDTRYAPLMPDWFIGVSKYSANKPLAQAWVQFFVKDSGYVDESGFLPVLADAEPSLPQLHEFMSFNPALVESLPPSEEFLEISNRAQNLFWSGEYIQELVAAPDLSDGFDKLNALWRDARQSVLP